MSLRDSNVIIIETSRTHIRAGLGLYELLKTPSVELLARVGLRKTGEASTSKPAVTDYIVGLPLEEALAGPDASDIVVSWPFLEGEVADFVQAEALWKHVLFTYLQRKRTVNESPVLITLPTAVPSRTIYERTCQIFFERFNVPAFAILDRPLAQLYAANSLSGIVVDIGQDYTDITPINEGVLMHSGKVQTKVGTRMCRHYLAHLLKSNTSVAQGLNLASLDPTQTHATLLRLANQLVAAGLVKPPTSGEAAPPPEDEGVTDIAAVVVAGKERAVIESGMKKKLNAKASAAEQARAREIEAMDLVTVEFEGKELTVGKERHRFCEPIFDPALVEGLGLERFAAALEPGGEGLPPVSLVEGERRKVDPLQDAVGGAVAKADVDIRQYLWQGLFVTGDITRFVKGIGAGLQSRLSPFITGSGLDTDVQPKSIRVLNLPEYYAEYRDTGNGYAVFLGSSIVAKIIFNDNNARNYLSKADYTTKGPHGIIEMSPSLL
ncbi:hypothetical protein EST38_g5179 [Candolleomyces aberdarensis]|uniref:Actin-related protein n=1 Tax=Candolleomyces aberdarensis TaxID=2316362 RepID=A0A4Q2DL37_9AGAR|nr:hypothetical protein EST38_g5179 [Candolleomyces aberdarensis]